MVQLFNILLSHYFQCRFVLITILFSWLQVRHYHVLVRYWLRCCHPKAFCVFKLFKCLWFCNSRSSIKKCEMIKVRLRVVNHDLILFFCSREKISEISIGHVDHILVQLFSLCFQGSLLGDSVVGELLDSFILHDYDFMLESSTNDCIGQEVVVELKIKTISWDGWL